MSRNPDDDPTLSPAEIAKRLGDVSTSFVYAEIEHGRLTAHRLGKGKKGLLRVSENQYRDYLAKTQLNQEEPPCLSANSSPADGRPIIKTSSDVYRELGELLTPKKKVRTGSPRSTKAPRTASLDTAGDAYSGKH